MQFGTIHERAESGSYFHREMCAREKELVSEAICIHKGNQTKAAKALGINRGSLRNKLARHGINSDLYRPKS